MSKCVRIKKKKRKICIGDLRDLITLQNRSIQPPEFGEVDYVENFNDTGTVFSLINTVSGTTYFDGVNTETPITHEIYIRFDPTVTAETWVEFDGKRIDILSVEHLDERKEWLKLICNDRGLTNKQATQGSI